MKRPPLTLSDFMKLARLERGRDLDTLITRLRAEPDRRFMGADFYRQSDLTPGKVHKLLDKLARVGLVSVDPRRDFKPTLVTSRYWLTEAGQNFADAYLQESADE